MGKVKAYLEDQREKRFQELCEKWMEEAIFYGKHPDDDCDWVQEMAAAEQEEEEREAEIDNGQFGVGA